MKKKHNECHFHFSNKSCYYSLAQRNFNLFYFSAFTSQDALIEKSYREKKAVPLYVKMSKGEEKWKGDWR
jgi:hypothetical protein